MSEMEFGIHDMFSSSLSVTFFQNQHAVETGYFCTNKASFYLGYALWHTVLRGKYAPEILLEKKKQETKRKTWLGVGVGLRVHVGVKMGSFWKQ